MEDSSMNQLEKEIKNYRILAWMRVRATGSVHGKHPRRCLWDICGKPMIQWSLEPAIQCKYIDKIVMSTEDRQIKDVVEGLGVQVIDRPLHQAHDFPRDYSTGVFRKFRPRSMIQQLPLIYTDTFEYMLYWLDEQEKYIPDIFLLLQANYPLGTLEILNKVVEVFFKDNEATEARTYYPLSPYIRMLNSTTGRLMPLFDVALERQLLPRVYSVGPYILYGHPRRVSFPGRGIAAVYIEPNEGLEVHSEEDLFLARCYMKRRLEKKGGRNG